MLEQGIPLSIARHSFKVTSKHLQVGPAVKLLVMVWQVLLYCFGNMPACDGM